ncbi:hypothetical protein XMV201_000874 [Aliiroseovarius sp. xm-v-201]|uniref:SH3 domain-containing protein n=1 Tax=unclassified Aliiroseovarius TaxID=2623558 RepID=UPI001568964E|nr:MULTISPECIES: SH3 domain-containing protein [unclassified Aliiroseovarius]NRP49123.1 hypothetical protein [Aliiroseovarius sp. xm-m-354]NRQ03878.1 hypothetical protein [Aliiroseovarius sp. xm-m-309]NRQ07082.1 hypothetical protein [Aliiroseovarius sp. xm-v-201]
MKAYIQSFLFSILLTCSLPFNVAADEVTDVVNDVAANLVQQLPMDKKIALKSLSPEETGLPEDFLRKLTSDLEAALFNASDFEINLANRATMEDVWQEAVEFNNADFDELFKSANADVMLMMSPRAISTGVEIAITAYSLTGDNVGKTLASSGSVLLPIDLQANLGVDVNDLNKQMAQVLAEIEKVGQTGGLISNPNTYAEFYHNARLLQQRGEVDLAMRNYEQALAEGFPFVDPLLDLLDLANARYGPKGAEKYFEKKISPKLNESLTEIVIVQQLSDKDFEIISKINKSEISFSPALALWLRSSAKRLKQLRDGNLGFEKKARIDAALLTAVRIVKSELDRGTFSDYFIDKIRSYEFGDKYEAEALEQELNRAYVHRINFVHEYQSMNAVSIQPQICKWAGNEVFELSLEGTPLSYVQLPELPADIKANLDADRTKICAEEWKDQYVLAVKGRYVDRFKGADFIYDGEGFSGSPCRLLGNVSVEHPPWDGGRTQYRLTTDVAVAEKLAFTAPELMPIGMYGLNGDYAVYADACLEIVADVNTGVGNIPEGEYVIPYLGGLIITDQIDYTQPILVYYQEVYGDGSVSPSNIMTDGTYVSRLGPTVGGGNADWGFSYERTLNNWMFAPGLLQSSILQNDIKKIVYKDLEGREKVLTNIEYVDPYSGTFLPEQYAYTPIIDKVEKPEEHWQFEEYLLKQIQYYRPKIEAPLTCYISERTAKIINVESYTNLRQQAGLRGRVIGRVGLDEEVRIVDPGSFLRYDRCAAACNGTNQNAIKTCVDNNDVWIEVQYNGRRGFLSRKFLE